MVGNRKTIAKLFCVFGSACLVLASCGGSSNEGATVVEEQPTIPEVTIPTVDLQDELSGPSESDPNGPESVDPDAEAGTPSESLDSAEETSGGGVVPKPSGDKQQAAAAPAKPTETQPPATTAAPKPAPAPALPNTPAPSGGSASDIERRIADLTNQLRTNPNGPLKRTGNVPTCNGNVKIDPATGQPLPVPALRFDDRVSVEMARPWSAQLSPNNFKHRQNQQAVLQSLGISPRTWGENIAHHAPPKGDPAMFHFTQWRQSDGHFCNMMNGSFTAIGVGEHQHGGGSFATQNFFA